MHGNRPAEGNLSESDPVARAAADWIARVDRGLTSAEATAFEAWKSESPCHRAEFARLSSGWLALDRVGAIPALAAMADAVETNARSRRFRYAAWRRAGGIALAAAAALAVLAFVRLHRLDPTTVAPVRETTPVGRYLVERGSAHEVSLADASTAEVKDDGIIIPDYRPSERAVTLARGEAHFHVARDPIRPFVVSAGPVKVRALGTAFDVRLAPESIQVLVTEGTVSLGSADQIPMGGVLGAGDRAIVRLTGGVGTSVTVDRPSPADSDHELAWETTRLVFNRTPLSQVVEAFNRFNSQKMILADPTLGARTLTGTFRADNLTGFSRLLSASIDVVAEPNGAKQLVLRAATGVRP